MNFKTLLTLKNRVSMYFIYFNLILIIVLIGIWGLAIHIPLNYKVSITCISISIWLLKLPEDLKSKVIAQFTGSNICLILILIQVWKVFILFSLTEKIIIICITASILLLNSSEKFKFKMNMYFILLNISVAIILIGSWKFSILFPLKYKACISCLIGAIWLVELSERFKTFQSKWICNLCLYLYIYMF